jgi:hypothetical protein
MKQDPYWFFRKWGINEPTPLEILSEKVQQLEDRILILEEESIEQSNALYECWNSLDARIDILTAQKWTKDDVR